MAAKGARQSRPWRDRGRGYPGKWTVARWTLANYPREFWCGLTNGHVYLLLTARDDGDACYQCARCYRTIWVDTRHYR